MWYWILNIVVSIWVFLDAKNRKDEQPVTWAIGTFLIMIVVAPFYFAKRPLKEGEVREGGTAWNVLKSFSLFWTIMMFFSGIYGIVLAHKVASNPILGKEGAALAAGMGMVMLISIWFIFIVGALLIGMFLKKSSVIERGPTGALAKGKDL